MFKETKVLVRRSAAVAIAVGLLGSAATTTAAADAASEKVTGNIRFDCILEPFKSGFRYEGEVAVTAWRTDDAGPMQFTAMLPDLPGIAPVKIEGGRMHTTVSGTVGGEPMELGSTSTVDAEPKASVPMPPVTGSMEADVSDAVVELSSFHFHFDEMMGINISAECEATDGGRLGALDDSAGGQGGAGGESDEAATALAVSESGDKLPVLVLWAVPAVLVVIGAVVWLPRRLRARS